MNELLALIKGNWGYLVVAAPGFFAIWRQWSAGRAAKTAEEAAKRKDRNDLVKIAQEAAGEVIEDLRAENARVRDRLAEIEREFSDFRRRHDTMIADKDAKITLLEGEVRQWRALAETYERLLEAQGIPHAKPGQTVWEAKEGGLLLVSEPADPKSVGAGQ